MDFYYNEMSFGVAVQNCAVGESIYQVSNPHVIYAKNHNVPLCERVPKYKQGCEDWRIYDPREQSPKDRTRRLIHDSYFVHHVTREEIDHKSTGARLRKEREENGISLRQLAKRLDVSASYLSDLERGKKNWSVKKVRSFISALNS